MTPLSIIVKVTLVLAAGACGQALIGRRVSAATRHHVWMLTLLAALLLPMLSSSLPSWTAITFTVPASQPAVIDESPTVDAAPSVARQAEVSIANAPSAPSPDMPAAETSLPAMLLVMYVTGVIVLLSRLIAEHWSIRRLTRQSSAVTDPEWLQLFNECADVRGLRRKVRLLRSLDRTMPMAVGVRQAAILIPALADTWSAERRRAVLLHEVAHIVRRDCLTQMVAAVACAAYWFHPGVWWMTRRLREERELACDDSVLAAGTNAREYAEHLLEIAYTLGNRRAPALAVSMASSSQLEGRMLAVLDAARNRAIPAWRSRLAAAAIAALVVVPVACANTAVVPIADAHVHLVPPVLKPMGVAPRLNVDRAIAASSPAAEAAQDRPREPQRNLPGAWSIRPARESGMVHVQLTEENSTHGFTMSLEQLRALTSSQFTGDDGPVKFSISRDAGTFTFDGVVRNSVGAGTFTFAPNLAFAAELAKRGYERPSAEELRPLAQADIGLAFLDELNAQGYARPTLETLVRAGQHGVGVDYLREMGREGYRVGRLDDLITMRDHGVTVQYVRDLRAAGFANISATDIVRVRDHGVTPEYLRDLRDLGYGDLPLDTLVRARDHGVTPDFVSELRRLNYRPSLDGLITARDHGVTPDYVRGMDGLGYTKLSLEALVQARDHGVTPGYAGELRQLGYQPALEDLIRARDHGVTPEYVRSLDRQGYQKIPLDDLIRMRDHGVTADYIGQMKTLGYKNLSVDELVRLRDRGSWSDDLIEKLRREVERLQRETENTLRRLK
jgi:beta-lactamase regulating signal transducer with metallopeptidase domain